MIKKSHRILSTFGVLGFAIGFILILSFIGGKSKGPLEGIFSKASSLVSNMESNHIVSQRKGKREDKLKWFAECRLNRDSLLKQKVILLGTFDNESKESFKNIIDFEDSLKTTFSLIHIYTAWGSKEEEKFPSIQVKAILEMGSIPVITWEPWLTDFSIEDYPNLKKPEYRDKGGLADVAKGLYDPYIRQWANDAKQFNSLIILRVGHEMNDPYRYPWGPQNNKANDFIAAWKHIFNVFKAVGAINIIWVWSPHPAYGWFDAYYPGDKYVDYVGISALNYGTVASWSQWWTFDDIVGKPYHELMKFNKPIMITEFGSLSVGGDRSRWFSEALRMLPWKYPGIKSIVFFHYSNDITTTQQPLNWYLKYDPQTISAINKQLRIWPDSVKPRRTKQPDRK
ncbi:MAG: glycosyl hydrolase [Bacteroidales bacterium]|nr:glycosyl hydrolase [Bacteroidales bacterium]